MKEGGNLRRAERRCREKNSCRRQRTEDNSQATGSQQQAAETVTDKTQETSEARKTSGNENVNEQQPSGSTSSNNTESQMEVETIVKQTQEMVTFYFTI